MELSQSILFATPVLTLWAIILWKRLRTVTSCADVLQRERDRLQSELTQERIAHKDLIHRNAHLQASLDAEQRHSQMIQEFLQISREEMAEVFAAASASALEQNTAQFMQIARSTFQQQQELGATHHDRHIEQVQQLLVPLKESLGNVDRQFTQIERERVGTYQALRTQVDALHETTRVLSSALRSPKTRGRWGEMHLRRVVELAGMQEKVDFSVEVSTQSANGVLRPDMVVHMPDGRCLVVDAKSPLDTYSLAMEEDDGPERDRLLSAHAQRIRQHVKELSTKQYHQQFERAPEFVVLYLPGEAIFAAGVDADPNLLDFAFARNVHVASPSTLMSILRGVAHGWHQRELADNTLVIAQLGKELHDRISKLTEHWGSLAKHLTLAVEAYNNSTRSMEARLLPTARKLAEIHRTEGVSSVPTLGPIMNSASSTTLGTLVQPIP